MKTHLGPPRELVIRRLESDRRHAMMRLATAMTIVAGGAMVAIAVFTPHANVGRRVVELISGGAVVAVARDLRRPSERNVVGLMILTWIVVVAVFALR